MNSNNIQKISPVEQGLNPEEDPFAGKKSSPEAGREQFTPQEIEKYRQEVMKEVEAEEAPIKRPATAAAVQPTEPVSAAKSAKQIQIESILEEDLSDTYYRLEPAVQQKFKPEGEKTAATIDELLGAAKVKTHKIFKLILNWLKIIPGVNKFFLRQEAKIKADKIIKLK